MINDFIIKGAIIKLEAMGYDIIDHTKIFNDDGDIISFIIKFKEEDDCLYCQCPRRPEGDFDFDKDVIGSIKEVLKKYDNCFVSVNNFIYFIEFQFFMLAAWRLNKSVYFHWNESSEFFKDIVCKYKNRKEFLNNFENIDFSHIIS